MKPVTLSRNSSRGANRGFPVIDFNYRSQGLDRFNAHCAGTPRSSFEKISQSYFDVEARRNFAFEACGFILILATTLPAIVDCARALAMFVRAIGGV
ncbi:MAG TPA: hypothetical protein VEI58_02805 [Chthoniobacterales bacterium]|nr:hypothetical protein [Chthoniobacterales bacterium]